MAYIVADYHDIGPSINRENHETESSKIIERDPELRKYFINQILNYYEDY